MQLELAENSPLAGKVAVNRARLAGKMAVNRLETLYLLVPDPREIMEPIFVRLDQVAKLPLPELNYLLEAVAPFNTPGNMKAIRAALYSGLKDEDTDYVETANTVVTIIDTVIGWFGGSSGGSSGNPAPTGSIIGMSGFIACAGVVNGNITAYGVNPGRGAMIAFSNLPLFLQWFPNLPNGWGSTMAPTPLPSNMPTGMVNYSNAHPDQVIRRKSGGGFEVVPNSVVVGWDTNGNPIIDPPSPDPSDAGTSSGGGLSKLIIPAGIAFLLAK